MEEDKFEALPELIFNSDKVDLTAPGEAEAPGVEQPAEKTCAPRRRRRRGGKKPFGEGAQNEARVENAERKPQPERKPQEKKPCGAEARRARAHRTSRAVVAVRAGIARRMGRPSRRKQNMNAPHPAGMRGSFCYRGGG